MGSSRSARTDTATPTSSVTPQNDPNKMCKDNNKGDNDMTEQERRDQIISSLIEYDLKLNIGDPDFLRQVFLDGWDGYRNLSDEELITLYNQVF